MRMLGGRQKPHGISIPHHVHIPRLFLFAISQVNVQVAPIPRLCVVLYLYTHKSLTISFSPAFPFSSLLH